VFNLFFKQNIDNLSNGLIQNCASHLGSFSGEGTLAKIKKILGWMVNSRLLEMGLHITKGNKWIAIILNFIDY